MSRCKEELPILRPLQSAIQRANSVNGQRNELRPYLYLEIIADWKNGRENCI